MSDKILPDSRCQDPKGIIRSRIGNWIPIFCANCWKPGGAVPEENMTFAFFLCNNCEAAFGPIAATMMVPDEVFWNRVREEQLERYGRELTPEEWQPILEDPSHPLTILLRDIAAEREAKR